MMGEYKMYGTYTQNPKPRRTIAAVAATIALYAGILSYTGAKKPDRPYADRTTEIKSVEAMRYNALDGLYLTVEESRKAKDNGRQIVFFDYGFDGKLDKVTIRQHQRKDCSITNQEELTQWQPYFEEMRSRRFEN